MPQKTSADLAVLAEAFMNNLYHIPTNNFKREYHLGT